MRNLAGYLGLSVVLVAACHGGSSAKRAGDGGASSCDNLACLRTGLDIMMRCAGGDTCVVQQGTTAAEAGAICFDNGVKIRAAAESAMAATGFSMTYSYEVKKNDALCYTRTFVSSQSHDDGGLSTRMDTTLEDASGTTIATARIDNNDVITVTCPGQEPTVYTTSCGYSQTAAQATPFVTLGTAPPTCTAGSCTY
jgi:hypothetical protein